MVCCAMPPNTDFNIGLRDDLGNDLLDPDHQSTYNRGGIRLLNLIDGEYVEQRNSSSSYPWGYRIRNNSIEERFEMRIFQGQDNFLIKWSIDDYDTLQIETTDDGMFLLEIRYNNVVVWDEAMLDNSRYFEVIKE